MAENNIFLCENCMALAINDRIIDHISEDLLHIPEREFQEQPELEVDCRKYDALPKLPNLAAAADEGCQFCAFLMVFVLNCYYQLLDSNTDGTSDESESSQLSATIDKIRYVRENDPNVAGFVTRHAQTGIIGLAANVHIYHEELEEQLFHTTVWLPVRANDMSDHQQKPLIGTKPISHEPLSDKNLELITSWIKDCDSHAKCGCQAAARLPTRLIDVGEPEGEPTLRLVNTADHGSLTDQFTRYIALSYCWGLPTDSKKHLKTTLNTIGKFFSSIPYQDMPQTLRDAIEVTRKLRCRYIWIDALCIIQDDIDQADWKRESVRMKEIYGNAYLTIAPISSHSSFDGFLSRNRHIYMRVPIHSAKRPELNGIFVIGQPTSEGRFWHGPFSDDVSDSTWDERGWTLQEKKLSRRILYFGERTIHFTCNQLSWSGDSTSPGEGDGFLLEPTDLGWCLLDIPNEEPVLYNSTYQKWYDTCSNFSGRVLTNRHDTLPAISGLADHYAKALQSAGKEDTYMMGLWANDLLAGLCWAIHESLTTRLLPIPTKICRPSWTWATHSGEIDWQANAPPTRFLQGRCKIIPHLPNLDQNPFTLTQGYLTIQGHMEKIAALVEIEDFDSHILNDDPYSSRYAAQKDGDIIAECYPDFEGLVPFSKHSDLSLLLLAESFATGGADKSPWLVGLILTRSQTNCESEFIRIGVFRIIDNGSMFKDIEPQLIILA